MKVLCKDGLPIKYWADEVEPNAMEQAERLATLPFAFKHIALMPDVHMGYGMPIGGVMACRGVIVPNAVGVDIGCGMAAIALDVMADDIEQGDLKQWMGFVRNEIPMGFKSRGRSVAPMPHCHEMDLPIVRQHYQRAELQLGTLGGGNHFIEFQRAASDGRVWLMIHSGSRNLGKQVCDYYNLVAQALNAKWCSVIDPKWKLAFLPYDESAYMLGTAGYYDAEMNYCVRYAKRNRWTMMDRITQQLSAIGVNMWPGNEFVPLDVAHNYAVEEEHFGERVMVHRKGATSAKEGELGIIPGSQGTCSYIVRGKGNKQSFESCSHGAGRRMGRKQAQRTLDLQAEIAKMDAKGIVHGMRHVNDLDEAASAYKDIDVVMAQQADLVEIVERLEPLAVIKG